MGAFDVAIVGGGPAGSSCAAFCALAGLRTLVLERENFPREKVCGDCLNPSCWPVLERLGVAQLVRDLPHSRLAAVEFIAIEGHKVIVDLPTGSDCELSVKRSLFDDLLLKRACDLGAHVREGTTVTALAHSRNWKIETRGSENFLARTSVCFSSATQPVSWSRLPAKEFITPFARENWPQRRSLKLIGAKTANQLCVNSLALAPKCIVEDSGSIGWRVPQFCRLVWGRFLFMRRKSTRRS